MKQNAIFSSRLWALLLLVPLVGGCDRSPRSGNEEAKQVTKPLTVEERAQQKWDAQVARDWKKVYDFLTPAKRKVIAPENFAGRMAAGALDYQSAKVLEAKCPQEDSCTVAVEVTYIYNGRIAAMRGMKSTSRVEERWIRSQGEWWFVPE